MEPGYQNKIELRHNHTVWVSFNTRECPFAAPDELDWRYQMQRELGATLVDAGLGYCDGGGSGGCEMYIHFFVDDIQSSVELVKRELSRRELLGFVRISSCEKGEPFQWEFGWKREGDDQTPAGNPSAFSAR